MKRSAATYPLEPQAHPVMSSGTKLLRGSQDHQELAAA